MPRKDGSDIKYLLEKKGYSLSDVARDLRVTPQAVQKIIWGDGTSQRVIEYIEKLLGMKAGTLRIIRKRRADILRAA